MRAAFNTRRVRMICVQAEIALIAAIVTIIGWLVTHILQVRRDEGRRRVDALLRFTERQLDELYGPLALLVVEGRRTYLDLLDVVGRDKVFQDGQDLSPTDLAAWMFWAENDFIPRNEKIKQLLITKTHLIEGTSLPESYLRFLNHHNSWIIQHLRWKRDGVAYSWHSRIDWPKEFETDVLNTFAALKVRHTELIKRL